MKDKAKGYVFPINAIKAYKGQRGAVPSILKLGSKWNSVVNFPPQPFLPPERARTNLIGRCVCPKTGMGATKRNFAPTEIRKPPSSPTPCCYTDYINSKTSHR